MEQEQEELPIAIHVPMDEDDGDDAIDIVPVTRHFLLNHGRQVENVSPYLYDLIRENCTCTSVLSGWSSQVKGCSRIVEHCENFPNDVFYRSMRSGRTPLHEACLRCSCIHVIRALLSVNPERARIVDNAGNSPLHLFLIGVSTHAMNPDEMDEILDELLAPNPSRIASICNREGSSALHVACLAPETMIHPQSFRKILEANPSCATRLNNLNQSALRLHCQRRNASTEVARMLTDVNPDAVSILDGDEGGWTPLHYAAANSNSELIRWLVRVDPEAAQIPTSSRQETALHILSQKNAGDRHLPAFRALLAVDATAVTMKDGINSYTPLHLVCRGTVISPSVVRAMVNTVPRVAEITDRNSYLPLHHACEVGADVEVVEFLLAAFPAGATAVTKKHDTALSLACACNKSLETVQLLIQANEDALTTKNDYGFVPLHCVCRAYQPRIGIVQALLNACPKSVAMRNHSGETPVHMACSNVGYSGVGVLEVLTSHYEKMGNAKKLLLENPGMTNEVGNTPLHYACFRGNPLENIEALAISNPEWIMVRNNAGYTPLQIMCKNGRIHDRIITTFYRIGGPGIFSVVDLMHNTPLHSAMREETDVQALRSLIRAFPEALHSKTAYGDTPLHLACFRRVDPEVLREVALASSDGLEVAMLSCNGRISPILTPNTAGQTPIGIAIEEFQTSVKGRLSYYTGKEEFREDQKRAFDVLATLVKILHYGPSFHDDRDRTGSLVRACVSLHRRGVRLDPAFILRALHLFPEEARILDDNGNYPLHIEASIPVEKMPILNGSCGEGAGPGGSSAHLRINILRKLLEIYPEACKYQNNSGEFPLSLMIQNGRQWDQTFALVLRTFPQALHYSIGVESKLLAKVLEQISKECGVDTLFALITSRPDIAKRY